MCVCVHWCLGVYIHMQAHNESVRLSCAADFIFRKAATLLFVPDRISHPSLSEPVSISTPDCPRSGWRIWWEQVPGCRPEHTAANQSLPCWAPASRHLCGNWAALALWQYDGTTPSLHWKRHKKKERNIWSGELFRHGCTAFLFTINYMQYAYIIIYNYMK